MPGRKSTVQIGERNGSVVVLEMVMRGVHSWFWVQCDCGSRYLVRRPRHRKHCKACGHRITMAAVRKHGSMAAGSQERRLYQLHQGMLNRIRNPNVPGYKYYGGKGITVCPEWRDYITFRAWALSHGYVPGLSIARLDPSKNYEPSNCEFVTRSENSRRRNATSRPSRPD